MPFGGRCSESFRDHLTLNCSCAVLKGQLEIISELPKDHWLLMLGYALGDAQPPTVTGKLLENETAEHGGMRELTQETGMNCTNIQYIKTVWDPKGVVHHFCADAQYLTHADIIPTDDRPDMLRDRVSVLVHGKKDTMHDILHHIANAKKMDNIVAAYIVSKADAVKLHTRALNIRMSNNVYRREGYGYFDHTFDDPFTL